MVFKNEYNNNITDVVQFKCFLLKLFRQKNLFYKFMQRNNRMFHLLRKQFLIEFEIKIHVYEKTIMPVGSYPHVACLSG